jgi:hypothetical protein
MTAPKPRPLLDISTSHIPEAATEALNASERVMKGTYGWFVPVFPGAADDWEADGQAEIGAVVRYAETHGFEFVLFDADAPAIEDLPTWQW